MKLHSILLAAGLMALAGCSSTPSSVSSGTIHARTFSFVDTGERLASLPANRQTVLRGIQDAITKDLAAKGVQKVPENGDVTVAFLLIVGNNVVTTAIDDCFGFGRNADALLDKAHSAAIKSKDPNAFTAGTLVIDIIGGKNFKLLSRTHVTRPVLENPTAETRAEHIQEAVTAALAKVRFEP